MPHLRHPVPLMGPSFASGRACPDCDAGGIELRPPSPEPVPAVLELRPAQREPFWFAWFRQPAPVSSLRARIRNAAAGTTLGFVRDGGRVLTGSLRKTLQLRALRF